MIVWGRYCKKDLAASFPENDWLLIWALYPQEAKNLNLTHILEHLTNAKVWVLPQVGYPKQLRLGHSKEFLAEIQLGNKLVLSFI